MVEIYAKSRINLGFGGIGYSTRAMCLKGRDFEVPMSGALYLTSYNPELESMYDLGQEIVTYRDPEDCLRQIRYFLSNPSAAESLRHAARGRGLSDHTWVRRFGELFNTIGFSEWT